MPASVISNIGAQVNMTLRHGADFQTTLTFTNPDGSPVNLTGCTLAAQIRQLPLAQIPPLAFFTCVVAADPTKGLATMSLPGIVSETLTVGASLTNPLSQYSWDLTLTDALGRVSCPLYGQVSFYRDVTR